MVVIDAHCHLSQRWTPTGPATLLIDDMDATGVDMAIVFGVFGDAEDNAFVAKSADEHPDRFIPFVNFDPSYEEVGLELVDGFGLEGIEVDVPGHRRPCHGGMHMRVDEARYHEPPL